MHLSTMRHFATVDLLPYLRKWIVQCTLCGQVGIAHDHEADAWAIAERHNEIQGFER